MYALSGELPFTLQFALVGSWHLPGIYPPLVERLHTTQPGIAVACAENNFT
jgi:hypothetical protein